jgi:hypothetical protein
MVLKYRDKPWDYNHLIINPGILAQDIIANIADFESNDYFPFEFLSSKSSLTFQDISENADYPWTWFSVGKNSNIFNVTSCDPDYTNLAISILAANKIKRKWFTCITNPDYKVCKRRLLRELQEDVNVSI